MFDNKIDKILTQDQITFSHHSIKDMFILKYLTLSHKILLASLVVIGIFTLIFNFQKKFKRLIGYKGIHIHFQ